MNPIDNAGANSQGSAGGGSYKIFTQSGIASGSFSSINAIGSGDSTLHPVVDTSVSGSTYLNVYRLASAAAPGTSKAFAARSSGVGRLERGRHVHVSSSLSTR